MTARYDVDVLVCGGGPAGLGAAAAAARAGARTLLVERYGFFGGVAAFCPGMPMNQMLPDGRSRGAVHDLFIDRLKFYGPRAAAIVDHAVVTNNEYLKVAAMDVLDAVGARYLFHGFVAGAIVEQGRVAGVRLATKEGLADIRAKVTVDCTGDADVAFHAGAETLKGGDGGFLSPMTLGLLVTGFDVAAARAFAKAGGMGRVVKEGRAKYPLLPASMHFEVGPFPIEGCLGINHAGTRTRGVLDGTHPEDMTEAERFSRRQAIQMVEAMREFGGDALKNVQLAAAGPQPGVRETRRVKGLYVLTEEDAKEGRRFDDAVAWRSGFLDIGFVRFEKMKVHDVPYRALVPEKMDGLLVAGRCISASHVAASAGKSMGNCVATGHAAGQAAAMCAQRNCRPRDLPVGDLQKALAAAGVPLERCPGA
jgi:hypothetical protein